ncbi:MAG: hypothetical protein E7554_03350 [Ruminococcaceae bacterium]|nr:hypothetical protein [Oscillospiraceae bacterium]
MARFWRHNERLSPYDDNAFTEEELESIADTVRESSFIDDHSGRSIDQRMTEFFGGFEPNWICFQAPDAVCYVNCYGVLRRGRQAIKVELQFELSDDLEDFALTGLSINNRPQPEMAVAEFEESFAAPAPGQELPTSAEYDEAEEAEPEDDGWYDDEYDDEYYGRDIAEYDLYEEDGAYEENDSHDHSCGCGHHHHHERQLYDFEADYVEPIEEEQPDRLVSFFGNYGAFPVTGHDVISDDGSDEDE